MQAVTQEQVEEYVATFAWFRDPARQAFLATAADRLAHTLNLIPRLPEPGRVRVLEVGGRPYFMTTASLALRAIARARHTRRRPPVRPTLLRLRVMGSYLRLLPGMVARRRRLAAAAVVSRRELERWLVLR